jgi:hypothetical protein
MPSCHALLWTRWRMIRLRTNGTAAELCLAFEVHRRLMWPDGIPRARMGLAGMSLV